MKILHTVEFYEPSKGGAQEVVRQLSERLAKRGHDVTVATSVHHNRSFNRLNGVRIVSFGISGNAVKGIRSDGAVYQQFLIDSEFDIILNYASQTWTTDLTFPILDHIKAKKIIAPLGYSRLHSPRYRKYFAELPPYLKKYDAIVYTSAQYQDKQFGDEHGVNGRAVIIPNGASEEEFDSGMGGFRKKYGIDTKYMFLNVSNHYFDKGHRMVLDAFKRVNSEDCTLVIIGERPSRHGWYSCYPFCALSALRDRRIRILQKISREDVVNAYLEADLFLFGSKIECAPLVMYEAFASKTPFVTTNVGNVMDHNKMVKIISTAREMSHELEQFIVDPTALNTRGERAFWEFMGHHTWERLSEQYEKLYVSIQMV